MVARPEAYRESSYRAYLGLCDVPVWLHTGETLSRFQPGDARASYRAFVTAGIDDDTREFYAQARRRPILGSEEFRKRIEQQVRGTASYGDPEQPDHRLLGERPTLDDVAEAVCLAFDTPRTELRWAPRRTPGLSAARGAFVLLGREAGGRPLVEIAGWIGFRSYAAASKAMIRLRDGMCQAPETRDRVEAARSWLRMRSRPRRMSQVKT
jgi:hypothetical protein